MPNGPRSKQSKTSKKAQPAETVEPSSGNVFADLDLPHPELALAKARLVQRIRDLIAQRELTQVRAARILGIDQPKISALLRGRVSGYSLDRLFRFLNALGQDVEITIRPQANEAKGPAIVVV